MADSVKASFVAFFAKKAYHLYQSIPQTKMCGIGGVVRRNGRIDAMDHLALARMLRAEAHRGPDDEGAFSVDRVLLGHARLAVIDLSASARQPMPNETGDVWVTFNGEIYNFEALRAELLLNHHILDDIDFSAIDLEDHGCAIDRLAHERSNRGVGQDRNENRENDPTVFQNDVPIVPQVGLRFRMEIDHLRLGGRSLRSPVPVGPRVVLFQIHLMNLLNQDARSTKRDVVLDF